MKRLIRKSFSLIVIIAFVSQMIPQMRVYAKTNVTEYVVQLYAIGDAPVYETASLKNKPIVTIENFLPVHVTGITDNGFYQVDLSGIFYVPIVNLVAKPVDPKKEAAKEFENQLEELARVYAETLSQQEEFCKKFALVDITGDKIPEIILDNGKEALTYYNGHTTTILYSDSELTYYYNPVTKTFLGFGYWGDMKLWRVYYNDTSLLPWGQFKVCSYDATPYVDKAVKITYNYNNDVTTRANLKKTLKEIYDKNSK